VNIMLTRKEEHSKKPQVSYRLIEACSPGPYVELFARERVKGWHQWGDQVDSYKEIRPNHRGYRWNTREEQSRVLVASNFF